MTVKRTTSLFYPHDRCRPIAQCHL
jgi:hypothetical protein